MELLLIFQIQKLVVGIQNFHFVGKVLVPVYLQIEVGFVVDVVVRMLVSD